MMRETGVHLADEQAQRLASLTRQEGRSRAEILRAAIVAYQPTGRNDRSFALADGFARVDRVHSRSLRSPSRSCGGFSALDLIVDAAPLVALGDTAEPQRDRIAEILTSGPRDCRLLSQALSASAIVSACICKRSVLTLVLRSSL